MNNRSNLSRVLRIAGVLGCLGLSAAIAPSAFAGIDVNINLGGPPPPRHEVHSVRDRPGTDYVWVGGYWGGSPGHYEWVAGRWQRPSHRGAVWVAPRWERHGNNNVFVKGYWR